MPPITSEYFFFSGDDLIWFSTAQGLTSFDGSELLYHTSLKTANAFGLNRISAIAEDKDHNLYIGTSIGLYYFDRVTRSCTPLPYTFSDTHLQPNIGVFVLYCDNKGLIYGGSFDNGLFVYDPAQKKMLHYNLDATQADSWTYTRRNSIRSIAVHATDTNKLWIGSYHGIYLFDKVKRTFIPRFNVINPGHYEFLTAFGLGSSGIATVDVDYDIQQMDVANDSVIWFNCWTAGFGKYNTRTGEAKLFLNDARLKLPNRYIGYVITKFAKLSDEKYLLGIHDGKTAIFDTRTETATYFNISTNDLPIEQTRYVANDRHNNTWVLQRGLLYRSIPEQLRLQTVLIPNPTTVSWLNPKMRGIYFDKSSYLFYAAFLSSTGVHVYDSNFRQLKLIPTRIINNFFSYNSTVDNSITKDGSGRFWTAGWESYVWVPGAKKFESIEKIFPSLAILQSVGDFVEVATSRDGNVLLKKNNETIYIINHLTLSVDSLLAPQIKKAGVDIKNPSGWYDEKNNFVYQNQKGALLQTDLEHRTVRPVPYASLFGDLPLNQGVGVATLDAESRLWFLIPKYGIRILDPTTLACIDSIPYGTRGLMRGDYTTLVGGSAPYMLFRSQNGMIVYNYKREQSFLFDHSNGLSSPDNKGFLYSNGYMIVSQDSRFEYYKLANLDNYSMDVRPHLNTLTADTTTVLLNPGNEQSARIRLPYYKNTLGFSFSATEFIFPERIEYAYQLLPVDHDWHYTNYFNRKIIYSELPPDKYTFRLKAQMQGGNWQGEFLEYTVIIEPAWWQTNWFRAFWIIGAAAVIIFITWNRINSIRERERQKTLHEKALLELEASALRAQMNPHFIFNSLNSIKSMINKNENDKASGYLTTFSKLIRTLFQNSDKREVSLYEELETCRLYTELEKMRFGNKVQFVFDIHPQIDLKDIKIPALVLQPFIENAIWHGLVPKESGGKVTVTVQGENGVVECIIDDNGIGRELSRQYKTNYETTHESKGIGLTQSRLELDKVLNDRDDAIAIIDKKNEAGNAMGTTVIITFKET